MDRRAFIKLLTSAAAAIGVSYAVGDTLNPLVIEEAAKQSGLSQTDIIAKELELIRPMIIKLFERDSVFFKEISKHEVVVETGELRVPLQIKPGRKS